MDRDRIGELVDELIDDRSVEALERLTGSKNEGVLAALIEAAGRIVDDDRSEEIDDTIVEEIQAHLVKCAKVGPLVDALEHKKPSVRELALGCLGEIGDTGAAGPMIERLEDEDPGVREAAAEHLTLLSDQDFGMDAAAWRKWLENVAEREKERVKEAREELAEKRQKKSKVMADVAVDEDLDDSSDDGGSDVEEDRSSRVRVRSEDDVESSKDGEDEDEAGGAEDIF